jgi:hypothetical protein
MINNEASKTSNRGFKSHPSIEFSVRRITTKKGDYVYTWVDSKNRLVFEKVKDGLIEEKDNK